MENRTLKGQSLEAWKDWIDNELRPPVIAKPATVWVIQALKEAILIIEKQQGKIE